MYTLVNTVMFDGTDWIEKDVTTIPIYRLDSYSVILVTAMDELSNYYLMTKEELFTKSTGLTIPRVLLTTTLTTRLKEPVKVVTRGHKLIDVKTMDKTSLIMEIPYPFVMVGNTTLGTYTWGTKLLVPDIKLTMDFLRSYSVSVWDGMENSTRVTWGSSELYEGYERGFIRIGPVVMPLREIFDKTPDQLRLKKSYRSWCIDLYKKVSGVIRPDEIQITNPVRIQDLYKANTIKLLLTHKETDYWIMDNPYPVTIERYPISKASGSTTKGVLCVEGVPTTTRIVPRGHYSAVSSAPVFTNNFLHLPSDAVLTDRVLNSTHRQFKSCFLKEIIVTPLT